MNFFKLLILSSSISFVAISTAQNKIVVPLETKFKKLPFGIEQKIPVSELSIGLALSGGGARGFAQIGVIKALEEAGINIEAIAGTSIGSIIGGAYASGYSVKEMDSLVINTNWERLLSIANPSDRRELFVDQKISKDRSLFTLRLDGFSPVIPTSFNEGLRLSNYLTMLCMNAPVTNHNSFDDLKIKYRAVCTDLVDGVPVILSKGSLSRAMRASSSVSFLLSPVEIDSLILVDGGLVSNVPVSVVKNMGADFIIAVNTTSKLREESELEVPWNIADQTVSIPMKILVNSELSNADLVIEPEIDDFLSTDFTKIDSLILAGYNSTKTIIPQLKNKLDSLSKTKYSVKSFWIKNIKHRPDEADFEKPYLQKYYLLDSVSSIDVYKDMCEIFGTGQYDSLGVSIIYEGDSTAIMFNCTLNPLIKEVEILANVPDDGKAAERIFQPLRGKPYNGKNIFNAIKEFISEYKKQGYILFNPDNFEFNDSTGKLILDFNPGIISEININSETSRTVIEREFNIKPGDRLRYSELEEGLQNLRATGLFDDINLTIEQNSEETVLNLNVHEEISSLLKLGFLVDNTYNAQLGLDFRDVNLFGTGSELGLFLFGGAGNRVYILEHIAHRILNSYFTYKLNAYYKFNDVTVYNRVTSTTNNTFTSFNVGKYRQVFYGTSLSLGTQLEKFGKLIFTGRYQLDQVINKERNAVSTYKTKIVGLRIGALVDNQNKYPYPDDGLYFNGYYETAQSFLGGDEGYIVVNGDLKYYFTLAANHVIAPRIQIGFGDKTLPLSEQFILGGQYSFFGAHENEFRGRQIFLASLMYQNKLPFKIFFDTYALFRYDLGSTWDVQEQIRFKDLRHGIGGTLSFDTPIGPADFSIGRSFIINKGLKEGSFSWGDVLFYFSVGHAVSF